MMFRFSQLLAALALTGYVAAAPSHLTRRAGRVVIGYRTVNKVCASYVASRECVLVAFEGS